MLLADAIVMIVERERHKILRDTKRALEDATAHAARRSETTNHRGQLKGEQHATFTHQIADEIATGLANGDDRARPGAAMRLPEPPRCPTSMPRSACRGIVPVRAVMTQSQALARSRSEERRWHSGLIGSSMTKGSITSERWCRPSAPATRRRSSFTRMRSSSVQP